MSDCIPGTERYFSLLLHFILYVCADILAVKNCYKDGHERPVQIGSARGIREVLSAQQRLAVLLPTVYRFDLFCNAKPGCRLEALLVNPHETETGAY